MIGTKVRAVAVSVAAILVAAGASCPSGAPERVLDGTWGGEHMGMAVSDSGAAIEYDCAAGKITEPLLVDADGDFNWQGVFYPGHGGPAMIDEKPDPHVARYSGHLTRNVMTMVLHVDDLNITQSYTLVRGANPMVFKCL
jgi:hypothetical protein